MLHMTFLEHSRSRHDTVGPVIPLRTGWHDLRSKSRSVSAGVQVDLRHFIQQATTKLARTIGFPRVVADKAEPVLGEPSRAKADSNPAEDDEAPPRSPGMSLFDNPETTDDKDNPRAAIHAQLGRLSNMNTSVDTLAEQMLTLVEIVSAQERDIKALKEQCRVSEEHDQAIAVAFSTFFHVLSAGRVAKLGEIASILNHIIQVAEQEGRPAGSIKFLRDLADMLSEEHR